MSDVLIIVGVWLALLIGLQRARRRRKLGGEQALLIWSVYLFAGCTFIFRAPALERLINAPFDGLPVAYGLKALFVLLAVTQYHRVMRRVVPPGHPRRDALLGFIGVALLCNLAFLLMGARGWLTTQQVYYSMMTLSDLAALLNMAFVFIPANAALYWRENLEPMRIKHIAAIVFCLSYVIAATITQVAGPYTVITGHVTPIHDTVPLVVILFFCFLIQVLPHRTLHRLLYVRRLLLLWKLRRLERRVLTLAGHSVPPPSRRLRWLSDYQLQTALYSACITILDYSKTAAQKSVTGDLLHRRIIRAATPDASYETLITALGRLA